ncbi:MAG: hypothetical protein OEM38_00475 [Gammaproteobacteria bacterium]|nr:hypothetical protein [Gammaproteobacteria bacterium]
MKLSHIISQLAVVLPKYTDLFTDNLAVNLAYSAGTVTATSATAHGLATGDYTTITDAVFPTQIASITRAGNIATVTTVTNHDLTFGYHPSVNIGGADQSDYNGDKALLSVPTRKAFTCAVTNDPVTPATGSMFLNEDILGYNGRYQVTTVSPTVFTYPITQTPFGSSTGFSKSNIRISGGVTYDRLISAYTEQDIDKVYCFVVPQPSTISRDSKVQNDATVNITAGVSVQIREIENFSVYIFVPSKDIAGRVAYDQIEDIAPFVYKSLVGVKLPSGLTEERWAGISPLGHGFHAYSGSVYIHAFEFQAIRDLSLADTADLDESVAFRDIDINTLNDFDNMITNANVNLDG